MYIKKSLFILTIESRYSYCRASFHLLSHCQQRKKTGDVPMGKETRQTVAQTHGHCEIVKEGSLMEKPPNVKKLFHTHSSTSMQQYILCIAFRVGGRIPPPPVVDEGGRSPNEQRLSDDGACRRRLKAYCELRMGGRFLAQKRPPAKYPSFLFYILFLWYNLNAG